MILSFFFFCDRSVFEFYTNEKIKNIAEAPDKVVKSKEYPENIKPETYGWTTLFFQKGQHGEFLNSNSQPRIGL